MQYLPLCLTLSASNSAADLSFELSADVQLSKGCMEISAAWGVPGQIDTLTSELHSTSQISIKNLEYRVIYALNIIPSALVLEMGY